MERRINRYTFNKTLRGMSNISPKEREYLNRVFSKDLTSGLSQFELKHRINRLRFDKKDVLDLWELESVKRKLLKKMEK